MNPRFAEVALPLPLRTTFTYEVPEGLAAEVAVGSSVLVPFGRRSMTGWVVELPGERPAEEVHLKALHDVVEPGPLFNHHLLELSRWMAEYYLCGWGEVLRAALPEGLRVQTRLEARIEEAGRDASADDRLPGTEQALLSALRKSRGGDVVALGRSVGVRSPHSALRRLQARGLVSLVYRHRKRGYAAGQEDQAYLVETAPEEPLPRITLTAKQKEVLQPLHEAVAEGRFLTALLHGVTSSGKTAIYEEVVDASLREGRGAIVLVPEIAITTQMVNTFRSRFGERVALFHSRMGARERYGEWRRVSDGQADVVIGPRSAVLAPVAKPGVIVVDEEHENSYKQSDPAPRYHARDVAVYRARLAGAVCLLGSATPSAESYHNAREGRYLLLELPERIEERPFPQIRLVDLAAEPAPWKRSGRHWRRAPEQDGGDSGVNGAEKELERKAEKESERKVEKESGRKAEKEAEKIWEGAGVVLSGALESAIADRLELGEQAILFINRRGFSPAMTCADCGHAEECSNCSVTMTYHKREGRLRCHYCGAVRQPPGACPSCGSERLRFQGVGTQRVEGLLNDRFPAARVLRMDSDAVSRKGAHRRIYEAFATGEGDILLGTQMVAKGFHFPRVTLVGVVSADAELHFPDFRANERTFQLLTQVSGRAGRGPRSGEVIIQTFAKDNAGVAGALSGDYVGFMETELESRKVLSYPPFGKMVRVLLKGRQEVELHRKAGMIARKLMGAAPRSVRVLGPAPAPLYRVNRWYRVHVLLLGSSAATLRNCVMASGVLEVGGRNLGVAVDVDPVDVL
ncbi:primosomal protein N' [Gemmatimonadota bacterium]